MGKEQQTNYCQAIKETEFKKYNTLHARNTASAKYRNRVEKIKTEFAVKPNFDQESKQRGMRFLWFLFVVGLTTINMGESTDIKAILRKRQGDSR